MAKKIKLIDTFFKKWADEEVGNPQKEDLLIEIENDLGCKFPMPYRYLITEYGDISTQKLTLFITKQGIDLIPPFIFYSLDDAVNNSISLSNEGLPEGLFAFASTMIGDIFCFDIEECTKKFKNDSSILCFSSQDKDVYIFAKSFKKWIKDFVKIK